MKTLGEIGYEKWRSMLMPHAAAGLPPWSKLPAGSKMAWEDVANTIVEALATGAAMSVEP